MASDKSLLGKLAATARRVADVAEAADKANPFAKKETPEAPETLQTPETPETPSPSDARPAPEKKGAFVRVAGVAESFNPFASKASPLVTPTIPPSFGKEVYRRGDLALYPKEGLVKAAQIVYYRSVKRIVLKTNARVAPGSPEHIGAPGVVDLAGDAAVLGSIAGPGGAFVGAAVGGALGLLGALSPAKAETHNQIWLETDDLPEPFLLFSDKTTERFAANFLMEPLINSVKRNGGKPEVWRDGEKLGRWRVTFLQAMLFFKRKTFF